MLTLYTSSQETIKRMLSRSSLLQMEGYLCRSTLRDTKNSPVTLTPRTDYQETTIACEIRRDPLTGRSWIRLHHPPARYCSTHCGLLFQQREEQLAMVKEAPGQVAVLTCSLTRDPAKAFQNSPIYKASMEEARWRGFSTGWSYSLR